MNPHLLSWFFWVYAGMIVLYPVRPRRWNRLGYLSWQRDERRRVEIALLYPLAALMALGGSLLRRAFDDLDDPPQTTVWLLVAVGASLVVYSVALVVYAWRRRTPRAARQSGDASVER